ncbi:MAG: DUF350 domain-containing protein [Planctomycetes bacterium]|jgi:uncharacterized membrane protein YjfL (UPF0719 family)/predicted small secreted protein|nr:DUF350 domain-containing protein [Planctomycetota bacterium]
MLETMAFGAGAALILLLLDLVLRSVTGHPDADTPGPRLLLAARVVAVFLLAATLATGCRTGADLGEDLLWMAVFGLSGLAAFELALGFAMLPLPGLIAAARLGNLACATAFSAHTIAIGILVANVFGGRSFTELGIAAASFAVGQVTLMVLGALWRLLTDYDDRAQMLQGNTAAALAHGGLTIALALLIAHATEGEFQGAWPALRDYAVALAEGLVIYPLRQLIVQCVILRSRPTLRGGELDTAIGTRGDIGAGALEGATYLAMAVFVVSLS